MVAHAARATVNRARRLRERIPPVSSTRSSIMRGLRPLIAIVMLALVAYNVPWRDRLIHHAPGGKVSVAGEIVGNWRAPSIGFRSLESDALDARWPRAAADELRSGRTLA